MPVICAYIHTVMKHIFLSFSEAIFCLDTGLFVIDRQDVGKFPTVLSDVVIPGIFFFFSSLSSLPRGFLAAESGLGYVAGPCVGGAAGLLAIVCSATIVVELLGSLGVSCVR